MSMFTSMSTIMARNDLRSEPSNVDPFFNNVVLLLPFDGNDGDTTTIDFSNSAHTITFNGTAQIDTAEKKIGTASLLLDGNSDYITAPDSADWDFATGDFTIECWYRFNNVIDDFFISKWSSNSSIRSWYFGWVDSVNEIRFVYFTEGGGQVVGLEYPFNPNLNQWYHFALCREGGNLRLFIDGVLVDTDPTISADDIKTTISLLHVGALFSNSSFYSDGQFDEVRITKGVARYSTNFTPPTTPYPTS